MRELSRFPGEEVFFDLLDEYKRRNDKLARQQGEHASGAMKTHIYKSLYY